jgi:hypothetical protein
VLTIPALSDHANALVPAVVVATQGDRLWRDFVAPFLGSKKFE